MKRREVQCQHLPMQLAEETVGKEGREKNLRLSAAATVLVHHWNHQE